jgi:hypothetical protein
MNELTGSTTLFFGFDNCEVTTFGPFARAVKVRRGGIACKVTDFEATVFVSLHAGCRRGIANAEEVVVALLAE